AESIVGLHVHDDVQVAGRTAVAAGTAATLELDALPVVHAGGDAHLDLARPALHPGAPAVLARVGDLGAAPTAIGARRAEREEPLVLVDDAATAAGRAGEGRAARLRPTAVADGAERVTRE